MKKKENKINLKESSDEKSISDSENNSNDENSIDNFDIDCERLTLIDVGERIRSKRQKKNANSLLLQKKRKNPNSIIAFDSSTKTILNTFCPTVEELNDLFENCKIQEIDLNQKDSNKLSENLKVFDYKEYMKKYNINKTYLSPEDSMNIFDMKENEEESFELKNPIMSLNMSTLDKGNENSKKFKRILQSKTLDPMQKKYLNNHIKEIIEMHPNDVIIKGKKLQIVFDLDNTLIFSFFKNVYEYDAEKIREIKENNPKKKIYYFSMEHCFKYVNVCYVLRDGIYEFVNYAKDFCDFHVNTASVKNYAEKIIENIEKFTNVKFVQKVSRDDKKEGNKSLDQFRNENINQGNTIIFDDSINVWTNDTGNVIQSKFFFDKELGVDAIKNSEKILQLFSKLSKTHDKFFVIHYPREGKKSWSNQCISKKKECPFYQFKEQDEKYFFDFYNAEYSGDRKLQFKYMKNVIKILYYMLYYDNVPLNESIKLIRLNIFYEKYFYLKYVSKERIKILSDIIEICGGEIVEPDESISYKMTSVYLVCSMNIYEKEKDNISNEKAKNTKYRIVNEKFILNSYYYMTNLEDDYHDGEYDPDYCLNLCNNTFK